MERVPTLPSKKGCGGSSKTKYLPENDIIIGAYLKFFSILVCFSCKEVSGPPIEKNENKFEFKNPTSGDKFCHFCKKPLRTIFWNGEQRVPMYTLEEAGTFFTETRNLQTRTVIDDFIEMVLYFTQARDKSEYRFIKWAQCSGKNTKSKNYFSALDFNFVPKQVVDKINKSNCNIFQTRDAQILSFINEKREKMKNYVNLLENKKYINYTHLIKGVDSTDNVLYKTHGSAVSDDFNRVKRAFKREGERINSFFTSMDSRMNGWLDLVANTLEEREKLAVEHNEAILNSQKVKQDSYNIKLELSKINQENEQQSTLIKELRADKANLTEKYNEVCSRNENLVEQVNQLKVENLEYKSKLDVLDLENNKLKSSDVDDTLKQLDLLDSDNLDSNDDDNDTDSIDYSSLSEDGDNNNGSKSKRRKLTLESETKRAVNSILDSFGTMPSFDCDLDSV